MASKQNEKPDSFTFDRTANGSINWASCPYSPDYMRRQQEKLDRLFQEVVKPHKSEFERQLACGAWFHEYAKKYARGCRYA